VASSVLLVSLPPGGVPAWGQAAAKPQEGLTTLRKRLPEAINRGLKRSADIEVAEKEVKVALCRRLSATEAKITVKLEESTLTFYLSYYEGAWTTIRHEERCAGFMARREKCVIDIALAIDEIGTSK
jgi:hypothetical protein